MSSAMAGIMLKAVPVIEVEELGQAVRSFMERLGLTPQQRSAMVGQLYRWSAAAPGGPALVGGPQVAVLDELAVE